VHSSSRKSPSTNQHPVFLEAGCPSCRPTNSVKALKGKHYTNLYIQNSRICMFIHHCKMRERPHVHTYSESESAKDGHRHIKIFQQIILTLLLLSFALFYRGGRHRIHHHDALQFKMPPTEQICTTHPGQVPQQTASAFLSLTHHTAHQHDMAHHKHNTIQYWNAHSWL